MKALLAILPAGLLPRAGEVNLDGRVLGFAVGAALLTGIVASLAPAWQALRADVNRALKEGGGKGSAGASHGRLRSALSWSLARLTLTVGAACCCARSPICAEWNGLPTRNVRSSILHRAQEHDSAKLPDSIVRLGDSRLPASNLPR